LMGRENILLLIRLKVSAGMMHVNASGNRLRITTLLCIASMLGSSSVAAIKNMAVVVSAGSKLSDIPLADLAKLCKGTLKAWPDGKSFTLVIKNPESPEMRVAVQKLFGDASGDFKAAIAKLNDSRAAVKIVGSDEELLHTVESTPGAVGILDVYSINSSVKVLRVDGKLPFDIGYALKGN
jgi:ABC-type phosphate transport system substrate-binding protein